MRRGLRLIALIFSSATLAGFTDTSDSPSPSEAEDVEAIKAAFSQLVEVSERGDALAYGEFLTDDALYMGPPMVVGGCPGTCTT